MDHHYNIVAIPGAGFNAAIYTDLISQIPDHSFEALTLPGHDRRLGTLPLHSVEQMAKYVRTRLDNLTEKSAVLLGHSMGALVAMEAAEHSAVAGIVVMGAAATMPVHPDLLMAARDAPDKAMELMLKWSVSRNHPDAANLQARLAVMMHESERSALFLDLKACHDYQGVRKLQKPALVIAGEDDKMTPASANRALAAHLGAAYAVLGACGHMIPIERPDLAAAEIRKFISNIDSH